MGTERCRGSRRRHKGDLHLENGFNPVNGALGQNSRMFGRQAYVGLSNLNYGTLTFGRQYDAIVGTLQTMTSNGAWGGVMFSHPYDNDNTDDYLRVNNSVKYVSPNLKGFTGTAMYAFSNAPGAFANNRMWSVGGIYSQGAFSITAAYSLYDQPGVNTTANVNTNGASRAAMRRSRRSASRSRALARRM